MKMVGNWMDYSPNWRLRMSRRLLLTVESCFDCPRMVRREVRHWLLGNKTGRRYRCNKAGRYITPQDGVKPPPQWCPLRLNAEKAAKKEVTDG